jgi:hypothetical protein
MNDAPNRPRSLLDHFYARALTAIPRVLAWAFFAIGDLQVKAEYFKLRKLNYQMRPDDIFIVTYPRSGTTWLQMIVYQLTSDGSMDFGHILEVAPFFEMPPMGGFAERPAPRLYKTHLRYADIPKGKCRYIYMVRDGKDVAISYYHLHLSSKGYRGDFSEFFKLFMQGKVEYGSWFKHVSEWWTHRNELNVLFLSYEDMLLDRKTGIQKIADFLGLDIAPEKMQDVLHKTSFEFMKMHEMKFDATIGFLHDIGMRPNEFIRKGKTGEGKKYMSAQEEQDFARECQRRFDKSGLESLIPPVAET